LERVKTKTWPFELTATPDTSPKLAPAGSLKKSGTESKASSGTLCCARATGIANSMASVKR